MTWFSATKCVFDYLALLERRRNSTEQNNNNDRSDTARPSTSEEKHKLKPFMVDVNVYFHEVAENDVKTLSRHLIAYDGNVHKSLNDETTHVIVKADLSDEEKEVSEYFVILSKIFK